MGSLANLSDKSINLHLVMSDSDGVNLYIHDTLKGVYETGVDGIFSVKTKSDFKAMLELLNIPPLTADKWVFEIEYKKLKPLMEKKLGIFESSTACFCVYVDKYVDFKEFKGKFNNCNDLYLSVLRRSEVLFLLEGYDIPEKVRDFVASAYTRSPDSVFELIGQLNQGITVENSRDVVRLVGAGLGSVSSFAFLLLADPPRTERGLRRVYSKRVKAGLDLIGAYGVRSFRNFLSATVYDILQLKVLYLEGKVYDKVRDLPDCYDEKKLSRYNMYLDKIGSEIPYERILRLYSMLQTEDNRVWDSVGGFIGFLYGYYGGV